MKKYFTYTGVVAALILFGFSLFPHAAHATCDPIYGEGERRPRIDTMGSVSLNAGQTTLTFSGGIWYPGGECPDPAAIKDGAANVFVENVFPNIASPTQYRTTAGPHTHNATLDISALGNGTYTLTFLVDSEFGGPGPMDVRQSTTFTITNRNPLSVGSCSGSPNPATTGSSMTWSVPTPTGGTGSYTYSWSGTDSLSGSTRTVNKTYSTTGTKNASVTVTSGAESATKNCSITVNTPVSNPTCSPSPSTVTTGQTTSITASGGSGGTSPYYTWNTGGGSSCAAGTPCSTSWTTTGTKTVTVTRNGANGTCTVTVTSPTNYTLTINKVADPVTGDGTNYADVTSVSPDGQISCLGACNSDTGSYASGVVIDTNTTITPPGTWVGIGAGSDAACADPMTMPARNATCNMVFGLSSAPTCSANPTSGTTGQTITFTGAGGTGSYTWSGGGSPATGSGGTFNTSYSSTGTKTVTVTSGAQSGTCTVSIGAPAALSCSGPANVAQGANATFNASGGTSPYSWTASGANPASGSGASFTTSWGSLGTKTVNVSGGGSASCTICVGAFGSCEPPPTVTTNVLINGFQTPQTVNYGVNSTVSWNSDGLICNLSSSPADPSWDATGVGASGSRTVSPSKSTTYTAFCRIPAGPSDTDSNTLSVRPRCLPAGQTIQPGGTASFTAQGGNGLYAWTSTGGTPASGSGVSYNVSYATEGTKSVTVTSETLTSTACTVTVAPPASTGTVRVNVVDADTGNPVSTRWTLTGPSGTVTQTTASWENTSMAAGTGYMIVEGSVTLPSGYDSYSVNPSGAQTLTAGGTITLTISLVPTPPAPAPSVDLLVNGLQGPDVEMTSGNLAYLSWTRDASFVSCEGSSKPSGVWSETNIPTTGNDWSDTPVTEAVTFTLACLNEKGAETSDSINVSVRPPECSDKQYWIDLGKPENADNDGDGITDFSGGDPGCRDADDDDERNDPECNNGQNDDIEDELIDYPNDPGCSSANDDDESNTSTIVTQCNDGLDNDADGFVDWNGKDGIDGNADDDPGCESALDPNEVDDPDIREI